MTEWKRLLRGIPEVPGVYSVWAGDIPLYIGRSDNMRRRLLGHNKRKDFLALGVTAVKWLKQNYGIFNEWAESHLIHFYRPALCKQSKWGLRAEARSHVDWAVGKEFDWNEDENPNPERTVERGEYAQD